MRANMQLYIVHSVYRHIASLPIFAPKSNFPYPTSISRNDPLRADWCFFVIR